MSLKITCGQPSALLNELLFFDNDKEERKYSVYAIRSTIDIMQTTFTYVRQPNHHPTHIMIKFTEGTKCVILNDKTLADPSIMTS